MQPDQDIETLKQYIASNEKKLSQLQHQSEQWWMIYMAIAGLYKELCFKLLEELEQ
jgi:hypothetical protein